jgi:phage tail protein X
MDRVTWANDPYAVACSMVAQYYKKFQEGALINRSSPKILVGLQVVPYGGFPPAADPRPERNAVYEQLVNLKNMIIRDVAVAGSYGWSFGGVWGMDDQMTAAIREANATIAAYEQFFVEGEKVENPDFVKLKSGNVTLSTWRKDADVVTFVFNNSSQPQKAVIVKKQDCKEREILIPPYQCVVHQW